NAREPAYARREVQEFADGQFTVTRRAFWQITQCAARGNRIAHHVVATHRCASRTRTQETRDHPHRCGLARAIRTQQRQHLPLRHLEVQARHRIEPAVALAEIFGLDHRVPGSLHRARTLAGVSRRVYAMPGASRASTNARTRMCGPAPSAMDGCLPELKNKPAKEPERKARTRRAFCFACSAM